jgi:hypothetical protein
MKPLKKLVLKMQLLQKFNLMMLIGMQGDVQYNVVRWASTPSPRYSGYGPSIANPRTGEIIAADIVQEFNAIKRGYTYRKLWGYTEDNDPLGAMDCFINNA